MTWDDICTNKWHFKKYRMQSKVILVTTAILIIAPAVFFFFCDFTGLPLAERILASLFQSVTPRTAGFNTADLPTMTGSSKAIMILLMLVGGSPGSTAGGMKTTTLAVLILSAFSVCRKKDDAEVCGRRIDGSAVKNAAAVAVMYFMLFLSVALLSARQKVCRLAPAFTKRRPLSERSGLPLESHRSSVFFLSLF